MAVGVERVWLGRKRVWRERTGRPVDGNSHGQLIQGATSWMFVWMQRQVGQKKKKTTVVVLKQCSVMYHARIKWGCGHPKVSEIDYCGAKLSWRRRARETLIDKSASNLFTALVWGLGTEPRGLLECKSVSECLKGRLGSVRSFMSTFFWVVSLVASQ